jgi:hypothetical protein
MASKPEKPIGCIRDLRFFNHEKHEKTWRGLIARNPHGLYTDFTRTLHGRQIGRIAMCQGRLYFFSRRRYGAPAARRHDAGFPLSSPKNQKVQKNLKNEKGFQGQQLAHLVFENLSQKRRFWVIVRIFRELNLRFKKASVTFSLSDY